MQGATPASDIWSLGATVCELVSGRPPYADLVAMSAMFRIVEDDRPPLPNDISTELEAFLLRCFRKDPKKRPTAEELFDDPWLLIHSVGLPVRLCPLTLALPSLNFLQLLAATPSGLRPLPPTHLVGPSTSSSFASFCPFQRRCHRHRHV